MYDSIQHNDSKPLQIAIDGPAGAGKSTVAKLLAERLGVMLLDSGAIYRAFTLLCDRNNLSGDAPDGALADLFCNFDFSFDGKTVTLGEEDISQSIRTPEIDKKVSRIAANPFIRKKIVELLQRIASSRDVVMEGRDIGSIVLNDSPFKFYLDASVAERAGRRLRQNELRGMTNEGIEAIEADIRRRDNADMSRSDGPLIRVADAVYIDSTKMTIEEIVEYIVGIIKAGR